MSTRQQTEVAESCELRRATAADRTALIQMYRDFEPKGACLGLPPHKDCEGWLDHLSAYSNFLALADGKVVGHAVLCPEADAAEIAVFVHQAYRGRGLGRRLLRELIQEAQRLGLRRVWGLTEYDNFPMLRLLRAFGFLPWKELGEFCFSLEIEAARTDRLAA